MTDQALSWSKDLPLKSKIRNYDESDFLILHEKLQTKIDELKKNDQKWTMRSAQQAVWSFGIAGDDVNDTVADIEAPNRKRKRID